VGAQEKTLAIQINGALASQIHSLLLIKNVKGSAQEMAKILDWKEGRVWINLKLAKKFTTEKLKKMLWDLKQIDLRAKTSDEPINLLLSLFIQKAKA
jgi:DNA polymerase III delta subunit